MYSFSFIALPIFAKLAKQVLYDVLHIVAEPYLLVKGKENYGV